MFNFSLIEIILGGGPVIFHLDKENIINHNLSIKPSLSKILS